MSTFYKVLGLSIAFYGFVYGIILVVAPRLIRKECRHLYFPVGDPPIGQECRLCGKFNMLEDINWPKPVKEEPHEQS